MDADKAILASTILTLGSTTAASVLPSKYGGHGKLPDARLLIGTSLTFMGLSMTASFAPQVAAPLAGALAFTAMTYYGLPILDNYFNGKHNKVGFP